MPIQFNDTATLIPDPPKTDQLSDKFNFDMMDLSANRQGYFSDRQRDALIREHRNKRIRATIVYALTIILMAISTVRRLQNGQGDLYLAIYIPVSIIVLLLLIRFRTIYNLRTLRQALAENRVEKRYGVLTKSNDGSFIYIDSMTFTNWIGRLTTIKENLAYNFYIVPNTWNILSAEERDADEWELTFDFTPEDIIANRSGRMSERQRHHWERNRSWLFNVPLLLLGAMFYMLASLYILEGLRWGKGYGWLDFAIQSLVPLLFMTPFVIQVFRIRRRLSRKFADLDMGQVRQMNFYKSDLVHEDNTEDSESETAYVLDKQSNYAEFNDAQYNILRDDITYRLYYFIDTDGEQFTLSFEPLV